MALELGASGLDQFIVLHAGRTGRHAGHAAQALVDVCGERPVDANLPLRGHLHQLDAAARRVHLLAPQQISWACCQAEATMDTVGNQFGIWRVMLIEANNTLVADLYVACVHLKYLPQSAQGSACSLD